MSGFHLLQIHPSSQNDSRYLKWSAENDCEKRILGTWTTCMRHLVFVSGEQAQIQDVHQLQQVLGFKFVPTENVFRYLLEIVCGLQSAVVGETEIQGQFKKFLEREVNVASRPLSVYRSFFMDLVCKAKVIREKHLRELGSQSYPSIVRKICQSYSELSFLGAGLLVEEILPWIKDKKVHVYNRSAKNFNFANVKEVALDKLIAGEAMRGEVLLIAAPLSNAEILELCSKNFQVVIDFRGEGHFETPYHNWEKYFHLDELAAQLEKDRGKVQEKVSLAMEDILTFATEFRNKMIIRPLGWDDLWC